MGMRNALRVIRQKSNNCKSSGMIPYFRLRNASYHATANAYRTKWSDSRFDSSYRMGRIQNVGVSQRIWREALEARDLKLVYVKQYLVL